MSIANIQQDEDLYYPSSDGQPMAEPPEHLLLMLGLVSTLRHHFKPQRDVYVIGNMFLYHRKGDTGARRAPDIMVVKGVDPTAQRRSFKTWVEGTVPTVVFELTSRETAEEDQEIKHQLYQQLGVREYFLFDPLNEYSPRQLMSFRLVNGVFEELIPDEEEALISEELGLRLVPRGFDLILIDLKTGQKLQVPDELYDLVEELEQRAGESVEEARAIEQTLQSERQRTEQEKLRAEQQRQLAEQEKQRAEHQKQLAEQEGLRAEHQKQLAEQERSRAEQQKLLAQQEKLRAEQERQRADQEKQRADALAAEIARLRAPLPPSSG